MSEKPQIDLEASFREMVTQWERNFDAFANQFMGTESFSKSMNQAQDAQLKAQQAFRNWVSHNLEAMHLPSRDDILRIGEAVHRLDRRLARIEEHLAPPDTQVQKKGPPRTKQPPVRAEADDGKVKKVKKDKKAKANGGKEES